jgi:hypothetical protein
MPKSLTMDDLAKQFWADAIRYGFQRNVLRGVKIARQIFIVPVVLSVAFVIGFIVAWISDPQRPTSDAVFYAALSFYLFFGSLAFIPFLVIASIAKKRISNDEYKIYEIRGSLVGLSLVALAYLFYLGAMAAGAPHERDVRAVDTAAVFAFLAAIVGVVVAFIGRVVGFYYGDSQKHKRQNSRLDWHPKNLCW